MGPGLFFNSSSIRLLVLDLFQIRCGVLSNWVIGFHVDRLGEGHRIFLRLRLLLDLLSLNFCDLFVLDNGLLDRQRWRRWPYDRDGLAECAHDGADPVAAAEVPRAIRAFPAFFPSCRLIFLDVGNGWLLLTLLLLLFNFLLNELFKIRCRLLRTQTLGRRNRSRECLRLS